MRRTHSSRAHGMPLVVAALLWLVAAPLVHADCPGNLLVNGGFEEGFSSRGAGEVEVANGWHPWHQDGPGQDQGLNHRPEYDPEIGHIHGTRRIREGNQAQKWGKVYASHNAGVYQQVNVAAGSGLRFTAWGQSWSSSEDNPDVSKDGVYALSVGIDPTGGTNWASPNVIWSPASGTMDQWVQLSVEATAQAGTVTVFVRGQAEFPLKHNDAYFDDACLTTTAAATNTPAPTNTPEPTVAPTATPEGYVAPTATPAPTAVPTPTRSGNEQVHTVQPGETLWAIATRYGLTPAELAQANGMGVGDILHVGRELIIPGAEAGDGPAASPSTPPDPTPIPEGGAIRVSVFDDINGNGLRDADEPLLAGARIILLSADGSMLAEHITDGLSETHTFDGLQPGTYIVREEDPAGYASTSANEWSIPLEAAGESEVFFANRAQAPTPAPVDIPPAGGIADPTGETEPPASQESDGGTSGLIAYSGIAVALVAVAVLVGRRFLTGRG